MLHLLTMPCGSPGFLFQAVPLDWVRRRKGKQKRQASIWGLGMQIRGGLIWRGRVQVWDPTLEAGCPGVTPLGIILVSASSLSPLDHLSDSHQLPQSLVRIRLERWAGDLGFPVPAVSQNGFMPFLWMSVSSYVSERAETDDPWTPSV